MARGAQARGSSYSPIQRETVSYDGPYGAGTIVVNTKERRLYLVLDNGKALKYGIGVGREGFTWSGTDRISRKAEWPGWTPPPTMIAREKAKGRILPAHMEGGGTIRSAPARSISARASTAFTAPTNRGPSATRCRRAAYGSPTTTSSTSTTG